jgi:hypothetical protein
MMFISYFDDPILEFEPIGLKQPENSYENYSESDEYGNPIL